MTDGTRTPEPWYYRFLDDYAMFALALGLLLTWGALSGGDTLADFLAFWAAETERPALIAWAGALLLFVGLLLGVVFLAAATGLAVDAARSLRAIRRRLEGVAAGHDADEGSATRGGSIPPS